MSSLSSVTRYQENEINGGGSYLMRGKWGKEELYQSYVEYEPPFRYLSKVKLPVTSGYPKSNYLLGGSYPSHINTNYMCNKKSSA